VARGRRMPLPDARPSEKIAKLFPQVAPKDAPKDAPKEIAKEQVKDQPKGEDQAATLPAKDPKGIGGKLGEVVAVDADGFTVVCADGRFKVTRVQPDGGKKVDASEFISTAKLAKGAILA